MLFLNSDSKENNIFVGNKTIVLNTMDQEEWQKFLTESNQKVDVKVDVEEFKEELWDIVVEFGEPILMGTGLDKEAREEFFCKMFHIRERRPNTELKSYKDSSTLKKKVENKKVKNKMI